MPLVEVVTWGSLGVGGGLRTEDPPRVCDRRGPGHRPHARTPETQASRTVCVGKSSSLADKSRTVYRLATPSPSGVAERTNRPASQPGGAALNLSVPISFSPLLPLLCCHVLPHPRLLPAAGNDGQVCPVCTASRPRPGAPGAPAGGWGVDSGKTQTLRDWSRRCGAVPASLWVTEQPESWEHLGAQLCLVL